MLVSIITSVYNCEKYISKMISSVLKQSLQDWEMIIIDDASEDNTWNLIMQYNDKRIVKFHNNINRGLTYNLNKALSYAKGKYIIRIDGDDIAFPKRFEKQVEYMENNLDVILSGCWMKVFGLKDCIFKKDTDAEVLKINLLFNSIVFHPTFIIRKSVLDKFNLKYNEEFRYAQDYDLEFRLSNYGKITNIPEILMYYRTHHSQISLYNYDDREKYANQIRKNILEQLGIFLENDEFSYWKNFCLLKYHILDEHEKNKLQEICRKIIEKNKDNNVYQPMLLEDMLTKRLSNFIDGCEEIVKKNDNNEDIIDKYYSLFLMMCQWMRLRKLEKGVSTYLRRNGIQTIAIYGIGEVGRILLDELINDNINVRYGIDRNTQIALLERRINILCPEDDLEEVDAIIVTAISDYDEIKLMLHNKLDCPVISLEDIILGLG